MGTHIGTGGTGMVPIKGRCGVGIPMPCGCFQTQAASPRPPHGGVGAAPCPQIVPTDVLLTCSPLCRSWLQLAPASGSHFGAGGGSLATPHPITLLQQPPPWCCAPSVPIPLGMESCGCILLAAPVAFLGSPPQSETETANGGEPKGPDSKKLNPKVPFPLLHILFGWQGVGNGMGAALQQVKPPAPLSPPA